MGKNLYGLGFSPLSVGNKDHAFPEELMSQKETGTFAIMGADGYMVSSEYLGRTKAHIESFANRMVADNTLGKIYKMTLDENLVRTVVSPENMMVNEIVIPNEIGLFLFFLFFVREKFVDTYYYEIKQCHKNEHSRNTDTRYFQCFIKICTHNNYIFLHIKQ